MTPLNGETDSPQAPLELEDVLHVQTIGGQTLDFEVVGILQDADARTSYAVLWRDTEDGEEQFIVTDLSGELLEDGTLAQQILDDFFASPEES